MSYLLLVSKTECKSMQIHQGSETKLLLSREKNLTSKHSIVAEAEASFISLVLAFSHSSVYTKVALH